MHLTRAADIMCRSIGTEVRRQGDRRSGPVPARSRYGAAVAYSAEDSRALIKELRTFAENDLDQFDHLQINGGARPGLRRHHVLAGVG